MKLFEKKNFIKIEKEDLKDARLSSADFTDKITQQRAFANVLGARLAMKMLFSKKIEANNVYSLYTIQNILKNFDIADIYYSDLRIDVRLIFNREEIFIPKSHFENDILPDLYLILELKEDLSGAEFIGGFRPENLNKENHNDKFYFIDESEIESPEDIKNLFKDIIPKAKTTPSTEDCIKTEELFLCSTDNEISEADKIFLIKQLSESIGLREKFVEFENFELISRNVGQNQELLQDLVLDIIGAQQISESNEDEKTINEAKGEIIEEVLTDLIEPDEIENLINEEPEALELIDEEDEFLDELKSSNDKKSSENGAGIITGAIGGAIAGAAAASAISGVAAAAEQGSIVKDGLNLASEGFDMLGELAKSSKASIPEPAKQMKDAIDIDDLEIIEDDSFFNETEEPETFLNNDLDDNLINMDEPLESEGESLFSNEEEKNEDEQTDESFDNNEEEPVDIDPTEINDDLLSEPEINENDFDIEELSELPEISEGSEDEIINISNEEENVMQEASDEEETSDEETNFLDTDFNIENQEKSINAENNNEEINLENIENEEAPLEINPENILENDELFDGLPELSLDFDNVQPEYLKSIQPDGEQAFETTPEELLTEQEAKTFEVTEESPENEVEKTLSTEENLIKLEDIQPENDIETESKFVSEENFISEEDFINTIQTKSTEETENNQETNLPEKEGTIEENTIDENDDSVISEVDNFLKDMNFTDEPNGAEDTDIDNINLDFLDSLPENTKNESEPNNEITESALDNTEEDKNNSIGMLFENKQESTDDLDIAKLFPTGQKIVEYAKKDKRVVIAASVAGVMLISLIAGGITLSNKTSDDGRPQREIATDSREMAQTRDDMYNMGENNQSPDATMDMNAQDPTAPINNAINPQTQNEMQNQISKDMGEIASDAFSSEPINATITKVAWEVPEELAYNDRFRKYLQMTGKNIKLNLQNDLLLASDMAYSNKVIVDLKLGRDGTLQSSQIAASSGSKQIDKLVLQSVKNTLQYLKMPADELSGDSADVTLIINF